MAQLNFFDCWRILQQQGKVAHLQCYFGYYEFLADFLIRRVVNGFLSEKNDFNFRHFYIDDEEGVNWQELLDFVKSPSFFFMGKKVALVTIRKTKGLDLGAETRGMLSGFFREKIENTMLIFHVSLEMMKDDYKQLRKSKLRNFTQIFAEGDSWVVDLDQFYPEQLRRFLQDYARENGKGISLTALNYLLEQFETDPLAIIAQMPKFLSASSDKNLEIEELSELVSGVSSYYIWDLSEALEREEGEKYLSILNYLFINGVSPTLIVGNLIYYYQRVFTARFLLEKGYQPRDVARLFNQERFFDKFIRTVKSFSVPRIKKILRNLHRLDLSCKRGSDELARIYLQGFVFELQRSK